MISKKTLRREPMMMVEKIIVSSFSLAFFFVPFSRALSTGEGVTHRRKRERERGELYVMMMGH
jgi:hypothetical protein